MKRREFITLLGGAAAAWPLAGRAQEAAKRRRIGVLMSRTADDPDALARIAAFAQGLQELGWTVGGNIRMDTRWGGGDLERIRSSPVRLLVVTTDLARRERRVFDNQTVTVDALMAASAVPGAFPPVEVDGALLVDGGLIGRAPVLEALESGTPVGRVVVVMSYATDEGGQRPTTMRRTLEEAFEMSMIHQIRRDTELARLKYPLVDVQLLSPSMPLLARPLDFDTAAMVRMLERGQSDALTCLKAWEK